MVSQGAFEKLDKKMAKLNAALYKDNYTSLTDTVWKLQELWKEIKHEMASQKAETPELFTKSKAATSTKSIKNPPVFELHRNPQGLWLPRVKKVPANSFPFGHPKQQLIRTDFLASSAERTFQFDYYL